MTAMLNDNPCVMFPMVNTSVKMRQNKRIVSTERRRGRKLSSSMVERVLSNSTLENMLAEEMKNSGVVTALGYQAVLQQFLLSDSVAYYLGESDDIDSSAEKRLKEMFRQKKCEESSLSDSCASAPTRVQNRRSSWCSSTPAYTQNRRKSLVEVHSNNDSRCSDRPSLKKRLSTFSLTESLTGFLIDATLKDELDVLSSKEFPDNQESTNLAPRRRSRVYPDIEKNTHEMGKNQCFKRLSSKF